MEGIREKGMFELGTNPYTVDELQNLIDYDINKINELENNQNRTIEDNYNLELFKKNKIFLEGKKQELMNSVRNSKKQKTSGGKSKRKSKKKRKSKRKSKRKKNKQRK
jgi:hypothetical protein